MKIKNSANFSSTAGKDTQTVEAQYSLWLSPPRTSGTSLLEK
jgi:hypothetical protein